MDGWPERIKEKVTPSERFFRKDLPLKEGGTNTICYQLM